MGFQPGDDTDIGSLFPKDVKLTVSDFTSGIVFDDESHELDDDQTTNNNNNNNNNTANKRTKEFFRRYIDDVYNGKVGALNAIRESWQWFFFLYRPLNELATFPPYGTGEYLAHPGTVALQCARNAGCPQRRPSDVFLFARCRCVCKKSRFH